MAIIKTKKEKEIYNMAITRAANLVKSYDGIIPNEFERMVIVDHILKFKKKLKNLKQN